MELKQLSGEAFNLTSGEMTTTSGSATTTQAGVAGRTYWITDISAGAAEATAVIRIFSNATTWYVNRLNGSAGVAYVNTLSVPIRITTGSAFTARVLHGNSGSAYVNISGYYI